jgi:hypothetical protein
MSLKEYYQLKNLYLQSHIYLESFFSNFRSKIEYEFKDKLKEKLIKFINIYEAKVNKKIKTIKQKFENDFNKIEESAPLTQINSLKFKIERYLFSNKTIMFIKSFKNLKNIILVLNDIYLSERRIEDMNRTIDPDDSDSDDSDSDDSDSDASDSDDSENEADMNEDPDINEDPNMNEDPNINVDPGFDTVNNINKDPVINEDPEINNNKNENLDDDDIMSILNFQDDPDNLYENEPNEDDLDEFSNKDGSKRSNLFRGFLEETLEDITRNKNKHIYKLGILNSKVSGDYVIPEKVIDSSFFNSLSFITEINFYKMGVQRLTENCLYSLVNLEYLFLSYNEISYLPPLIFKGLINLEQISFNGNELEKLDPMIFNGLKNLLVVDFSNNQIKNLDEKIFKDCKELTNINFGDNKIEKLDKNIFKGLKNLETIIFSSNCIQKLHHLIFKDLHDLDEIIFSSNKIDKLDNRIFKNLVNLTFLKFNNNNFKRNDYKCLFDNLEKDLKAEAEIYY